MLTRGKYMSFDNSLFFSKVPETLKKKHALLEAYIATYAEKSTIEADMLQLLKIKSFQQTLYRSAIQDGKYIGISSENR